MLWVNTDNILKEFHIGDSREAASSIYFDKITSIQVDEDELEALRREFPSLVGTLARVQRFWGDTAKQMFFYFWSYQMTN